MSECFRFAQAQLEGVRDSRGNSMAVQRYKGTLNQRSLSADRRWSESPRASGIISNAGDSSFPTASIRAIKKDFVKEQRKQFEQGSEVGQKADKAAGAVAALGKLNVKKSTSCLFLNQDQDPGKQCKFQDSDQVPTSSAVSPVLHVGRNCQSVLVEQRVSMFDNTGKSQENIYSVAAKPSIQPKPDRLSIKRPSIKNDDGKAVSSGAAKSFVGHLSPSLLQVISPAIKDANLPKNTDINKVCLPVVKASDLESSPKVSPKSDFARSSPSGLKSTKSKELNVDCVTKVCGSPDVGKILASDTGIGDKFADEGKTQAGKIKCNESKYYKPAEKMTENSAITTTSSNLKVSVRAADYISNNLIKPDVISPPPKPPRVLSELTQSPKPKPCKEQTTPEVKPSPQMKQMAKGGTYEQLTEAISVVKLSEGLANSNQTSSKSSLSPGGDITSVKTEPSNSPRKIYVDRSKIDQWWESKFIRAPQTATPRKKENFKTTRINNPSYMYAKVGQPDDIIAGRALVRHHSDELLDASPMYNKRIGSLKLQYNDGPIYHDPSDVVQERRKIIENVAFDKDGYAVPTFVRDAGLKDCSDVSQANVGKKVAPSAAVRQHERSYVKSKVSNAYAILRLPMFPGDQGPTGRDEDGEPEVDLEEHKKLLRHVSNVKYTTNESVAKYEKVRLALTDRLFQYAMIIGLQKDANGKLQPKILFCFPNEMIDQEVLTSSFCFPDADSLQPHSYYNGETFSFILTSSTGDRRYGLCKRYLPPGFGPRLPEALCIVSLIGEPGFYGHLLEAAEESRLLSVESAEEVLKLAYAKPFPAPNHEVYLRIVGPNNKKRALILKRLPDSRLHTVEFLLLLHRLSVSTLIKVFGAVLLERKVIFYSKSLSTLSSCICALVALLYPFEWQHTFVTILPSNLIDIIDAPTPYILGLLSSAVLDFSEILDGLIEVLVVDLDSGSLLRSVGDEGRIIPKKLQKALTVALSDDSDVQNVASGHRGRCIKNATVAETFSRMFVETCSHYTEYICSQQNGEIVFQRELFVKAVQSRSIRLFLDWFTQTQMFAVFITSRLKGNSEHGYFEQQILEYRQEMEETTSALGNMKAVGKKIADFFRGSGDKIKKTFQKAVYV